MKKIGILALFFAVGISAFATAQITGAVSFQGKKASKETAKAEQTVQDNETAQPDVDANELLSKRIQKFRIWNNPRMVKRTYGRLKGMQESIEKEQNKELEKKEYASEDEKQKALEEIKKQALVHFEDYSEPAQTVHQKMNENPRENLVNMTKRLSYIDKERMTEDYSEYIQSEMQNQFLQRNGVTMDEYKKASAEQLLEEEKQRIAEEQKSDTFPPLSVKEKVDVEKIDEQNALLVIGVGAPKSKKNK